MLHISFLIQNKSTNAIYPLNGNLTLFKDEDFTLENERMDSQINQIHKHFFTMMESVTKEENIRRHIVFTHKSLLIASKKLFFIFFYIFFRKYITSKIKE